MAIEVHTRAGDKLRMRDAEPLGDPRQRLN